MDAPAIDRYFLITMNPATADIRIGREVNGGRYAGLSREKAPSKSATG